MAEFTPFPTIAPEGTLSVGVNPEAFGAGVGEAFKGLGNETLRVAGEFRSEADAKKSLMNELFANDASTSAMKRITDLYSDYSRLEGRSAAEGLPKFQKDLDTVIEQSLANAPTLEAKAKLSGSLKYFQSTYYGYSRSYADSQFKKWQSDSSDQRAGALGTQAKLAVNNPDKMEELLDASDDEIAKKYEAWGYEPDEIVNRLSENRGKNTIDIVNEMLSLGDVEGAFAIFDMQDDRIDGTSRASILKVLRPILKAKRANVIKDIAIGRSIIDPGVLRAQIKQESGGDIGAVSPKGARGIMQLMPDTARMVAAELGLPYDAERLVTDKNYNMALGMHYMEGLLKQFGGNYVMALAGYNAGPGRVGEWIKRFGDPRTGEISEAEWIANIPFDETRNYVKTILANSGAPGGSYALPRDGLPNRADALQAVMDMTEGDFALRDEAISQLNQEYTVSQAAYVDQQRQQKLLEDARKEADDLAQNEYISDILSPTPKFTAANMAQDPRLSPESKRTLVGFAERVTKPEPAAEVSRETTARLMKRIVAPYGDPRKLLNLDEVNNAFTGDEAAGIAPRLTRPDFKFLTDAFIQAQTPEGQQLSDAVGSLLSRYATSITGTLPGAPADFVGDQNLYKFERHILSEISKYRSENKDPWILLDPKSPDFVGTDKALAPYRQSLQERLRIGLDVMFYRPVPGGAINGSLKDAEGVVGTEGRIIPPDVIAPPRRLPGESIESFEKRNKQSSLNIEDFRRMSLGNKLSALESLLG